MSCIFWFRAREFTLGSGLLFRDVTDDTLLSDINDLYWFLHLTSVPNSNCFIFQFWSNAPNCLLHAFHHSQVSPTKTLSSLFGLATFHRFLSSLQTPYTQHQASISIPPSLTLFLLFTLSFPTHNPFLFFLSPFFLLLGSNWARFGGDRARLEKSSGCWCVYILTLRFPSN